MGEFLSFLLLVALTSYQSSCIFLLIDSSVHNFSSKNINFSNKSTMLRTLCLILLLCEPKSTHSTIRTVVGADAGSIRTKSKQNHKSRFVWLKSFNLWLQHNVTSSITALHKPIKYTEEAQSLITV